MSNAKRRIEALERQSGGTDVLGIQFYDSDMISVKGIEMPLAEFERRFPEAVVVHLTWDD